MSSLSDDRLWAAVTSGDVKAAAAALSASANPGLVREGRPVLVQLVRCHGDDTEGQALLKKLLAAGADVNQTDEQGCTALSFTLVRFKWKKGGYCRKYLGVGEPHPGNGADVFAPGLALPMERSHSSGLCCAPQMMMALIDAGASPRVPVGYADFPEAASPWWGIPAEGVVAACVLQVALREAEEAFPMIVIPTSSPRQPAPPQKRVSTKPEASSVKKPTLDLSMFASCGPSAWERIVRLCEVLEKHELERGNLQGKTAMALAVYTGTQEATLALLRKGVSTQLSPAWCKEEGLRPGLTAEELSQIRGRSAVAFVRWRAEQEAKKLDADLSSRTRSSTPSHRV